MMRVTFFIMIMCIYGCGNKGALYLPEEAPMFALNGSNEDAV